MSEFRVWRSGDSDQTTLYGTFEPWRYGAAPEKGSEPAHLEVSPAREAQRDSAATQEEAGGAHLGNSAGSGSTLGRNLKIKGLVNKWCCRLAS